MVVDALTLAGMVALMFYLNWRFTLDRAPGRARSSSWRFTA